MNGNQYNNQYKICPNCRGANPPDAKFCAFCSMPLQEQSGGNPQSGESPSDAEFNGVPVRDVSLFVGASAPIYLKKFHKKSDGKKIGMNFIVLLLGFAFSAVAQSFWFFHRKMNKIGAVIFAVGVLFTSVSLYSAYSLEQYTEPLSDIQTLGAENFLKSIDKQTSGENISKAIMTGDYLKGLDNSQKAQIKTLTRGLITKYAVYAVIIIMQIALCVLIAAFADYIYYKFAIKKIKAIRDGPNYCDDALRFCGGTKTVIWALLLIFTAVLYVAATLLLGIRIV